MGNQQNKNTHYIIREISRLKNELYIYALVFVLFIIIALIIPDGTKIFLSGGRFYVIGFIVFTLTYLYEIWDIVIHDKNPIILSIDENGIILRSDGKKKIPRKGFSSKDNLISLEWREIECVELRTDRVLPPGPNYWEVCVHVRLKAGGEVWCSIYDYSLWIPYTSRKIRSAVHNCSGQKDLFIDKRRKG